MVLHGNQTARMAHDRAAGKPQLGLRLLMRNLVARIARHVDAVRHDGEALAFHNRAPEAVEPRLTRARHEVVGHAAHGMCSHVEGKPCQAAHVVLRMAVCDRESSRPFRLRKVDGRARADMPMHHAPFRMLGKKRANAAPIGTRVQPREARHAEETPAEPLDFGVVVAFALLVHEKVELDAIAIHRAVEVHHHGLGPAAIHHADHLQHTHQQASLASTAPSRAASPSAPMM